MTSVLNLISRSAYLVAAVFFYSEVQSATVQFVADGEAMTDRKIRLTWEHIGFVGDYLELSDGEYKVSIAGPREYAFEVSFTVNGQEVKISSTAVIPPCSRPNFEVSWPSPDSRSENNSEVAMIRLADPLFGNPTKEYGCPSAMMLGCTKRKIVLTATSKPKGGEIWIDGEKMPLLTDATLSVPYCEYEDEKTILVRMNGMINCQKSVSLSPDSQVSVSCSLAKPGLTP